MCRALADAAGANPPLSTKNHSPLPRHRNLKRPESLIPAFRSCCAKAQPSFIKMIPPTIMAAAAIRAGLALSPRRVRPRRKAPTDPIPVQTT